jgi:O-succinylbenzoate synthase
MIISYSPYTLKPVQNLNRLTEIQDREGLLLKIDWPDGHTGYADLHPWPELGDATWEEQLSGLRQGRISIMMEQAIWLARRDAVQRKMQRNIFDGLPTIKNNYLISDVASEPDGLIDRLKADGFESVKVKVGRDMKAEAELISHLGKDGAFKVRVDFNGIGTWQTYEKFMSSVDRIALQRVQYAEDPFQYDEQAWIEARKFCPIAIDNQIHKVKFEALKTRPFDVIVIKPAKVDVLAITQEAVVRDLKLTVTSYMDHPVGVMHSLSVACELKKTHPQRTLDAGCSTTRLYQMDTYAAEVVPTGPYLKRPAGKGIGFDIQLAKEPWSQIKIR